MLLLSLLLLFLSYYPKKTININMMNKITLIDCITNTKNRRNALKAILPSFSVNNVFDNICNMLNTQLKIIYHSRRRRREALVGDK